MLLGDLEGTLLGLAGEIVTRLFVEPLGTSS